MRVSQRYFGREDTVLTARCSFKQLTCFHSHNLQPTKQKHEEKTTIAIISKKGFHPSCILDLSCRRWHQVPLKICIVPAIPTDVTWTLLPLTNIQEGISTFKAWDLRASGRMIFCVASTFQGQWEGWRRKATLLLLFALLIVYAKRNGIFLQNGNGQAIAGKVIKPHAAANHVVSGQTFQFSHVL